MSKDSNLYSYKELDIGQFFLEMFNGKPWHYGIKLSPGRFFDLDMNRVCGFANNTINESDDKCYLKCDYEVW